MFSFNIVHDKIKMLFHEMLSISGTKVKLEENDCFKEVDPDNNQRPDLSIENNFHESKKVVCDISITHPYPILGSRILNRNQALQDSRAADLAYNIKNNKYKVTCEANNLEFIPLIFESTGKLHSVTKSFFDKTLNILKNNNNNNEKQQSNLYFYWSARLSCCIQKCLAETFLLKSIKVTCNTIINHKNSDDFIGSFRLPSN